MQTLQKEREVLAGELMPIVAPELHLPEKVAMENLEETLGRLGLKTAGKTVERIRKMQLAYSGYMFLHQENVDLFNQKLRKETLREDSKARDYKRLVFTNIQDWDKIPPAHVLRELDKAQKEEIFDFFEVAHIQWIREIKDPIIFGRVEGCSDRFFIAQWDDDVSIEELLAIR